MLLSILCASGYGGFKVFSGYRHHRGALVKFGHAVRDEAVTNHWRYEVINASDEGLLLYLQRLHFVPRDNAVAEWNRGEIDAVVAPAEDASQLLRDLQAGSMARMDNRGTYVLITH